MDQVSSTASQHSTLLTQYSQVQDSFRQLLSTPGAVASTSTGRQRGSLLTGKQQPKPKTVNASEPAFKPRKVKKSDSKYRDRASERRGGLDNDFTEIEAVLEDFVQRNKGSEDPSAIEEKRKYLGGDSDHSILVKGLDFALLEQNKARVTTASAGDDDESLEQAFRGATTSDNSTAPTPVIERKKKTREDFIRELKEKREKDGLAAEKKEIDIEEAKKAGKFRPIGFKPVVSQTSEEKGTKKRKKEKDGEKKQKKKRKVQSESQSIPADAPPLEQQKEDVPPPPVSKQEQDPEPDLDIFADAEEYTGLQIDEDEDDEETNNKEPEPEVSSASKQNWFDEPEEPSPPPAPAPTKKLVEEDEEEEQPPMRLIPLASSSVPSVKDILAMDQEAQKAEKRKARKEKRKEKKELTAEGKANRDYQKLMAFEKKKEK